MWAIIVVVLSFYFVYYIDKIIFHIKKDNNLNESNMEQSK